VRRGGRRLGRGRGFRCRVALAQGGVALAQRGVACGRRGRGRGVSVGDRAFRRAQRRVPVGGGALGRVQSGISFGRRPLGRGRAHAAVGHDTFRRVERRVALAPRARSFRIRLVPRSHGSFHQSHGFVPGRQRVLQANQQFSRPPARRRGVRARVRPCRRGHVPGDLQVGRQLGDGGLGGGGFRVDRGRARGR